MRGRAEVACQAHNLKVSGSIPLPATNYTFSRPMDGFFIAVTSRCKARFCDFRQRLRILHEMCKILEKRLSVSLFSMKRRTTSFFVKH